MARLWESAKNCGMKVPPKVRWAYQVTAKPETWPVRFSDRAEPVPRCNEGIRRKALRATGKCVLSHSPAEVSCATQVQAESAASCAALGKSSLGVAVPPSDAAKVTVDSAVADTENPPLYGRPCVMLALRENQLVTVGDSGLVCSSVSELAHAEECATTLSWLALQAARVACCAGSFAWSCVLCAHSSAR